MPIVDGNLVFNLNEYEPLPKQEQFHQSLAKFRLYIGAWRAGKTYAGCIEAYNHSLAHPKNCGIIFRKDYTDLRDTTMKTFFEVVSPEDILDFNKSEHKVIMRNGSEVYFRHLKDGMKLGSLSLGWFFIDEAEEVTEEVFIALQGRLSLKGAACVGWLVSNPPNTNHWLYNNFNDNPDKEFAVFYASTYENKKNLPEGYIESLEKLPPSWRKKYVYGQWGFTPDGKPYYDGYVEAIHKRDIPYIPGMPLHCGWDFGYNHPAFVATQYIRPYWNILYEIMGSNTTIDKFADTIVFPTLAQKFPGATAIHYGDPACIQKNDKSEQTTYQILLNKGILIHCKPSEYRLRKEVIEKHINTLTDGKPLLSVNNQCRIINDGFLGGYHYPAYDNSNQFVDKYERPFHDDFYSHLMNALEYIAVHILSPVEHKRMQRREAPGPMALSNI